MMCFGMNFHGFFPFRIFSASWIHIFIGLFVYKIWGVFSDYFFEYFSQLYPISPLLWDYGHMIFFSLFSLHYSVSVISMLYLVIHRFFLLFSPFCYWAHPLNFFNQLLDYFSSKILIWLFFVSSFVVVVETFFDWHFSFFFICFQPVCNCLLRHFYDACFKISVR